MWSHLGHVIGIPRIVVSFFFSIKSRCFFSHVFFLHSESSAAKSVWRKKRTEKPVLVASLYVSSSYVQPFRFIYLYSGMFEYIWHEQKTRTRTTEKNRWWCLINPLERLRNRSPRSHYVVRTLFYDVLSFPIMKKEKVHLEKRCWLTVVGRVTSWLTSTSFR